MLCGGRLQNEAWSGMVPLRFGGSLPFSFRHPALRDLQPVQSIEVRYAPHGEQPKQLQEPPAAH